MCSVGPSLLPLLVFERWYRMLEKCFSLIDYSFRLERLSLTFPLILVSICTPVSAVCIFLNRSLHDFQISC